LKVFASVATIGRMADKKKPTTKGSGRNKPSRMFRVPLAMANLLDELANEELGSSATEQLKLAIREYLQRKGKLAQRPA
jgi:hypothetical protein